MDLTHADAILANSPGQHKGEDQEKCRRDLLLKKRKGAWDAGGLTSKKRQRHIAPALKIMSAYFFRGIPEPCPLTYRHILFRT